MKSGLVRDTVVSVFSRRPSMETVDRIVAVALVVIGQLELWVGDAVPGPKWVAAPLVLVMTGAVAFRRRWPLASGSAVLLANGVQGAVAGHGSSLAQAIGWFCALYAIAVWTDTRRFLIGLGVLVAANAIDYLGGTQDGLNDVGVFTWVPIVAMLLVRGAVRGRQLRAEALAARAELLEREHELRANEAVAEERARIARELHDLVAHNVSVMVIQAGAERHALPDDQKPTRDTLESIEQSGRQALAEARRLLGMLRRDGEREELEPQPGVEQIDVLVEQVQKAGLAVTLQVEGEPVPLPAGLDLCIYRVVQEGLTNALKHAGRAHADVRLRYAPRALDVEIADDGTGTSENGGGAGHGLIGMRERVALYGGTLDAGRREGGGFEIRAHLPLG
jgi:signal transduction histidine kinase